MGLKHSQRVELERIIDERASALREQIRNTLPKSADETTLERTGHAQDEVDEATTSAEEHINHTLHTHYLDEMRQIEAARERAANGQLDCCAECQGEIGYSRLLAQPFAVRCVDCQERHERKLGVLRR